MTDKIVMKTVKDLSNLQKRQDEVEQGFKNLQTKLDTATIDANDLKGKMSDVCNYANSKKKEVFKSKYSGVNKGHGKGMFR